MAFLRLHQLSIMLFMSGACGILALMTVITGSLSQKRRTLLAFLEASVMLLLIFDRFCYIYRGNTSRLGWYMVRIGNGIVFFLSLFIPHLVAHYLIDLFKNEGGLDYMPKRLIFCDFLFMLGTVLIVISQFNGIYYIFDAENRYQRAPMYFLSVIIPTIMVILQISMLLQHRARLRVTFLVSLLLSISLPSVASIVQIFTYGLSLTNMTMVFMVIAFYMYMIIDLSKTVQQARVREVETQKNELEMFEQTTEALANAIESKDKYTSGHSSRVAMYSRLIAKEAGFDDQFCEKVYYSALLHDVGKIGVKDDIINKPGRLTDDEYDQIKLHPTYGYQILSSIKKSPYLSIGAHYHHERYDGKGYPDGLAGEEIPKIARIIAVADSFDAMTSSRSYRDVLPIHKVKEELVNGMGTQFDPKYAEIMLRLLGGGVGQQTGEK